MEDVYPDDIVDVPLKDDSSSQVNEQEAFCVVSKPERLGEGINAYIAYNITTKDKAGNSRSCTRRYSDFDWFHELLKFEYKHLIIPPLPEKTIFDRFASDFVEYRRKELERFLKRILVHPELSQSRSLHLFLTASELALEVEKAKPIAEPPPPPKKKEENFFASWTATITSAVTGPSVTLKETDSFFETQKVYLTNLDQQLQVLVERSDVNTKKKQELITYLADFSHAASLAAGFEFGHDDGLASFWEKLSQILQNMSTLTDDLVRGEMDLFENQIKDYIRIVNSCKDLMENRNNLLLALQTNKANLNLKLDKLKDPRNPEIEEATEETKTSEEKFNSLSNSAKSELSTFKSNKGRDIRKAIRELVRLNINHQLKVGNLWKELLVDLEDIK
jgi:sorting nexin-1/2